MNIAFVTTYDGKNILNWSGLSYYISKSLEAQSNEIFYIGNLQKKVAGLDMLKKAWLHFFSKKDFVLDRTIGVSKQYAKQVDESLENVKCDCVFSPGTIPIAYLKTTIPKVFYTDATLASMINYYKAFNNLSPELVRQGHAIEKQALDTCDLAIYSSDWAAQSAIDFYKIKSSKVKVVPFGANLETQYSKEEVEGFIKARANARLKILFNGVDWQRKGGDIVLATAKEIKERGIDIELHLIGTHGLDDMKLPGYVINHGFLNKSVEAEKKLLDELYKTSHFLFVPSNAEAFGVVFCEASSYGLPSISKETGGIPSAIINGRNGFVLNGNAGIKNYADLICAYYFDHKKYVQLALSSYNEFETRLNWKTTGASLSKLIASVI